MRDHRDVRDAVTPRLVAGERRERAIRKAPRDRLAPDGTPAMFPLELRAGVAKRVHRVGVRGLEDARAHIRHRYLERALVRVADPRRPDHVAHPRTERFPSGRWAVESARRPRRERRAELTELARRNGHGR